MKQLFTPLILVLCCLTAPAQTTATFENFGLPVDTFLNGSEGSGGYSSGNIFLPNNYDDQFQSWLGWSISTTTDTVTPGFTNQYSAITGMGYDGTDTYATSFCFPGCGLHLEGPAAGGIPEGFYITNSTIAYLSLLEGDAFAKKFGGEFGDDPDFFLLTIKKYLDGELGSDSINFYLADYRFENNAQDYIVKDWTYLDLNPIGNADSLSFTLTSSDVGMFGMNTPGYFCIDNVTTADMVVSTEEEVLEKSPFRVFPNPATDFLIIDWQESERADLAIFDVYGRELQRMAVDQGQNRVDVSELEGGVYFLRVGDRPLIKVVKSGVD